MSHILYYAPARGDFAPEMAEKVSYQSLFPGIDF